MQKLIIFDADSIIWTVAYKFRNKKVQKMMLMSLNTFITEVIESAGATDYIGFFGSKQDGRLPNFRYAVDPNYKKQRPEEPDWMIKWRPVIVQEMQDKWNFTPVEGIEADDAVAICAKHFADDYDEIVVAAVDKDLRQIPEIIYYNYTKHTSEHITQFNADKYLAEQMLRGDSADNIKGLFNIGPRKAANMLKPCENSVDLKWTVMRSYAQHEEELKRKAVKTITTVVKAEYKDSDWAKGKSEKQIERQVRITAMDKIDDEMESKMPGGWKNYYRQQYQLLKLLTEAPDYFDIPDPTNYKESDEAPVKDQVTEDFLYL